MKIKELESQIIELKKENEALTHEKFKFQERSFVFGDEIEKMESQLDSLRAEVSRLTDKIRKEAWGHKL